MSEKSPSPICVLLSMGDAVLRRRCEQLLRNRGMTIGDAVGAASFGDATAVVEICDVAGASQAIAVAAARIGVGVSASDAETFDALLPATCGDDELIRTVTMAQTIASLRSELARRAAAAEHWSRMAATDSLTGLPNRLAWDEALAGAANRGDVNESFCLAILDLDHFKQVNDQHGHAAGDEVLRAVGECLRAAIRRGDFCARIGGDEFGLLLPALAAEQAPAVLERLRRSVCSGLDARRLPAVTASIGYAIAGEQLPAELCRLADAALLEAKRAGRNRIWGSV